MKFEKLNKLLKDHQSATMRSYAENDDYLNSLRLLKEHQKRQGKRTKNVDKKLGKLGKLKRMNKI